MMEQASERATPCTVTVTPEGQEPVTLAGWASSCVVESGDFPRMAQVAVTLHTADVEGALTFARDGDFVETTLHQHQTRRARIHG